MNALQVSPNWTRCSVRHGADARLQYSHLNFRYLRERPCWAFGGQP
jgi:hypothetical protein